jgi:undecaprenyl-diphosphatase
MFELIKKWDQDLFIFLNNLGTEQYDVFWLYITKIETWIPLFIFLTLLIFHYYKIKKGILLFGFVLLTFAITLLITDSTKELVSRLRPNNVKVFSDLIRILQEPETYSFFSGHASSSFAITTFVVLALRKYSKWIYLVYVWPVIFTISRIYVGVHYPSDIAAGSLVGILMAYIFFELFKKANDKINLLYS